DDGRTGPPLPALHRPAAQGRPRHRGLPPGGGGRPRGRRGAGRRPRVLGAEAGAGRRRPADPAGAGPAGRPGGARRAAGGGLVKLGMVGLGRMGGNMAARLEAAGHEVVGYDAHRPDSPVGSLAELVGRLEAPRVVWTMVPAGDATEQVVGELAGLLSPGDLVVDGGNANWRDSVRRAGSLAARGVGFVDAGVSGGVWGRTEGYCLMVGGDPDHVDLVRPVFEALAPDGGGFVHAGPVGAGHYTKMVHNGVEYGIMQAYAEGYELLARSGLDIDVAGTLDAWRHGSVVRSWLLDLMVRALRES